LLLTGDQLEALSRVRAVNSLYHLLTFEPSPAFARLEEVATRGARILLRAANRVGKTRHVAWLVAKCMVRHPGFRARVVGPTGDHVHNVLGKYLAEFLLPYVAEGSYYVMAKGWNGGRARVIRLRNGSYCELKALADKPEAHSGASLHLVAFDEPPTLAHYTENAARLVDTLDEGWGVMIVAATMVNRPVQWLRDMVQGKEIDPGSGWTKHLSGWVQCVATFSRANCPWYSEEQVATWLETMNSSPWDYAQRVNAGWEGVTQSRIFVGVTADNFSQDVPGSHVKVGIGIDHGDASGHQCAVLIAWRGTKVWAIDEHYNEEIQDPALDAKGMLAMLERHGIPPTSVDLGVGDIGNLTGFTGWRVNEALQIELARQTFSASAPFEIVNPDKTRGSVDWGHRCINYAARRGDVIIHPRCHRLGQSLRHWQGSKRGPDGDLSHMVDAFRYALVTAIGSDHNYAQLRFE
jgi:hypothetical protein